MFAGLTAILNDVWDAVTHALRVEPASGSFPISGTVTASQGTPNTLANAWPVKVTDGANILGPSANPLFTTLVRNGNQPAMAGLVGDAQASTTYLFVTGPTQDYNGTGSGAGLDRHRNNVDATMLASGSRSTAQGLQVTTYNARGITVVVDVSNAAGGGSITFDLYGVDVASGSFYLLLAGLPITTVSTNVYRFQPGLPAIANKDSPGYLPRTVFLSIGANNANPLTYAVGYCLHC